MKLVISDLDGTLLYSRDIITEYTIKGIQKLIDKGIEFVIATGRGKEGVLDILDKLKVETYLICNNGATIYDKKGNCIYEKSIEKNLAIDILKTIRKNNFFYNAFFRENFYKSKDDFNDKIKRPHFKKHLLNSEEEIGELHKIVIFESEENILYINKILRDKFNNDVQITISSPNCIDIVPKGCNKGVGIDILANILKVDKNDIIAFGDGENDIDMLQKVGHPVIMENAQEILKQQIKNKTLKNTEDGVIKYLEKYFNL